MLTKKQLAMLKFIDERTSENGISPSFDEMREALNLKSKSGIHRLITALEERGFIRRLPHRARALEVIKNVPKHTSSQVKSFESRLLKKQPVVPREQLDSSYPIPLLGKIAAGTPIEAIEDQSALINVPQSMIGHGRHFALQVKGESMIDEGINHGDIVVIKEQAEATNGDIVVALIDDQEATLKRLQKRGDIVELQAANQNFKSQIFESSKVKIQGRLVGLLRTY
jgi:repressor LexA